MLRALSGIALGTAVVLGVAGWLPSHIGNRTARPPEAHVPLPLPLGVPFALEPAETPLDGEIGIAASAADRRTGRGTVEFTLPVANGERYLLIVGSLGDPAVHYRVRLTSHAAEAPSSLRGRRLTALSAGDRFQQSERTFSAVPASPVQNAGRPRRGVSVSRMRRAGRMQQAHVRSAVRIFHLHVTDGPLDDPRQYAAISAREIAAGARVRVFLDRQEKRDRRSVGLAREIVRLFEREILPGTAACIGRHCDVDGDGRLSVLLTPWLGRLQGGRTSLGGMVRPDDYRLDGSPPFGNRCDLLFLNSALAPGAHLKALLAHEYTHVVCFSRQLAGETSNGTGASTGTLPAATEHGAACRPMEDDWISEGTAHVLEQWHHAGWSNLDHRVHRFLDSPQSFPLVVPDYYAAGLWRNHGCRGATFLFLQWCVDRFGRRFLRRLIDGPERGVAHVEAAAGRPFAELFRQWTVALYAPADVPAESGVAAPRLPSVSPFTSLSTRGRIGRYRLGGPHATDWTLEDGERRLDLCGTSAAFVELSASSPGCAARCISVRALPQARLQLTLMRLK